MDHNKREDAVFQTRAGNALTMSGQHAYYNRQIALVSYHIRQMVRELLTWSGPHKRQNVGKNTQSRSTVRNTPNCA